MELGLLGACTDMKSKYSQLMAFMIIWNIDLALEVSEWLLVVCFVSLGF